MQELALQNPNQIYLSLKQLVESRGLMKARKVRYFFMGGLTIALLAGSYLLTTFLGWWGFAPGVILFAFFAVQMGFIGHDAAHKCISKSGVLSWIFGQLSMSLVHGVSYHYWWDRHNRHHANPNDEELDPDVSGTPYPFSEKSFENKRGFWRLTSKYPEYFLSILPFGSVIFLRINSWVHLIKKRNYQMHDFAFIAGHFALFLILPMYLMGWWQGILFYTIASLIIGFYFGSVFIPNHLGMPVVKDKMSFMMQQLITSRDIASSKTRNWWDFFFGGLNYQIEHHLFPTMPRWNLRKAKSIIREFCKERGLPYHEEGTRQTYKSLFKFCRKMGLTIRSAKVILNHSM